MAEFEPFSRAPTRPALYDRCCRNRDKTIGLRLPFAAAAAAAEIAAPLDAAHFGKCRPGAANRTIPFHPARRFGACPTAIASVQQRHGIKDRNGLERLRICAESSSNFFNTIAILAHEASEQS